MSVCTIAGCSKKARARGWCSMHWRRWRTTGDPNTTKRTPIGEPQEFLASVLAYEGDECLTWPYAKDNNGSALIWNGRRMERVCRIVCTHSEGEPPTSKHEAAHSCGNGHLSCVSKRHLSWKTHAGNMLDMILHGRSTRGEKSTSSKLTRQQVSTIRARRGKALQRELADEYGVANTTVCKIQTGKLWEWFDEQV